MPPMGSTPGGRAGLFLRLPAESGEIYRHAHCLLQVFEGPLPVYIRFADTGRMVRAPQSWWVDPQPILLEELTRLLGEENVVLKKITGQCHTKPVRHCQQTKQKYQTAKWRTGKFSPGAPLLFYS